ncbi:MAG: dienelactone hydrolase family protein [Gemmatimonadaceae bacterium]|nr:dienelactone hydrolase family protein [Gemmatimonadaceae bacterium]
MFSPRPVNGLLALGVFTLAACGQEQRPSPPAGPDVQTREVRYTAGPTPLAGFVAWDAAVQGTRPGVIVVHEWWGHNEHSNEQARRLARAGYVGFALDMYGEGKNTTHPDSAQAFMQAATSDMDAMVARFQAALEQLKADPNVDTTRIAAIGYCFGGAVVLGMAQGGADLKAAVSFHGAMPPAAAVPPGSVKARLLVLAGGADPMVPMAAVDSFATRLREAGASVEVVTYPTAMHGFTNPTADSFGMAGLKYDVTADEESWAAMLTLLEEVFRTT